VEAPKFFDRDGLTADASGRDFPDNDDRFILFCRAALETAKAVDFRPDIVHANDWQTGLLPAYLSTVYSLDAFFLPTASVFTLHDMAHQGIFHKNALFQGGFSWADFTPEKLEFYDQINFMKAGLVYANGLNTVSPTFAREIAAGPEFGHGLEGVLRKRQGDLVGILNGLDRSAWDPANDPVIARPFSSESLDGRASCKADLQKTVALKRDPAAPLLAFVSRLDPQKGADIVLETVGEALAGGAQAVFMGDGDPAREQALTTLADGFRGRAAFFPHYDDALARKIYAGSDVFLMPSLFEPCGLGQMIALRYGAAPVVTPTGGLVDTVEPYDHSKGTGTGFVAKSADAGGFRAALVEALSLYRSDRPAWRALQRRGMEADFGWAKSAESYAALYHRALERKRALLH
jgi:starch synthase